MDYFKNESVQYVTYQTPSEVISFLRENIYLKTAKFFSKTASKSHHFQTFFILLPLKLEPKF